MSIFKKILKVVKKIFTASSGKFKKSSGKKAKTARPKTKSRKISPKIRKSKVINVQPKKSSVVGARRPKTAAVSRKKNLSDLKDNKPAGLRVGEVTHYFARIKVCVIRIDRGPVKKGDHFLIKGSKGELSQKVHSMQIENEDVNVAKKGQLIGLKVDQPVFVGDEVFAVI